MSTGPAYLWVAAKRPSTSFTEEMSALWTWILVDGKDEPIWKCQIGSNSGLGVDEVKIEKCEIHLLCCLFEEIFSTPGDHDVFCSCCCKGLDHGNL
jgi:hypothetical protein